MALPRPDARCREASGLWAISAYFNPVGYQRRLKNYHVFRHYLGVPLVTVELSFDGTFQLTQGDADILVQLHGGDIMWQKERLLNLALRHLPAACDTVAWLDCDVIFARDDWPLATHRALDEASLVQLFHERVDLPPVADVADRASWECEEPYSTVLSRIVAGDMRPEDLGRRSDASVHRPSNGLGWAARRELLEAHGLYDASILGGADRAVLCAALGTAATAAEAAQMNPRRIEHYFAWADPFSEAVRARVGYLRGRIFHLWHGDLKDRGYGRRHALLADFDPFADIALDEQGCWRWSSDKPDLHARVKRYFEARREDGPIDATSPRSPARAAFTPLGTPSTTCPSLRCPSNS